MPIGVRYTPPMDEELPETHVFVHRSWATTALLVVLSVACGAPDPGDDARTTSWPIVTLIGGPAGSPTIDLLDDVNADGGHQGEPVGHDWRPVEVLQVLAVDELLLRTDRGVERVAILGLGSHDARLPPEINDAFSGPLREAVESWLTDPEATVFETSLPAYGARGAAAGPCYLSREGQRLVTLARHHPDDGDTKVDLRELALERGWGYSTHPAGDALGTEPRSVFLGLSEGFASHPVALGARESHGAEAALVADISAAELQARGQALQADLADWLGWTPEATVRFEPVTLDEFRPIMTRCMKQSRENLHAWAERLAADIRDERAAAGQEVATEIVYDDPPIADLVDAEMERLNGFSPEGPTIYILRKPELSWRQLDAVIVHELMHQYQEEAFAHELGFPPPMLPGRLGEAHAEFLSTRYRAERLEGFKHRGAIAYFDAVEHFAAITSATGLTADELYTNYLSEDWDRELWEKLLDFEISLQEFLFSQLAMTASDGLDFAAVAGSGLSEDNGPAVVITNTSQRPFAGQFHGDWIWQLADERDGTVTLTGPPFNLILPAGATVIITLAHDDTFARLPPGAMIGLFGRTPQAPSPR